MKRSQTLTVREIANLKGCTLKYVYDVQAVGRLPGAKKTGRTWHIPATAVEAWLKARD